MSHFFVYKCLIFFFHIVRPYKNGNLSVILIYTLMLGQVPILSLKLNAPLYLYNMSISSFFSFSVKQDLPKSIYFSSISPSVIYFLSSLGSSHGYFSFESSCCLSIFSAFINLLNCCTRCLPF